MSALLHRVITRFYTFKGSPLAWTTLDQSNVLKFVSHVLKSPREAFVSNPKRAHR